MFEDGQLTRLHRHLRRHLYHLGGRSAQGLHEQTERQPFCQRLSKYLW
ncbi:hypothetical protein L1D40_13395 [Shewanella insulae]|nr:hypothetical protein [Shewanella insulae]MCG9756205.1 hypothetical protein [Shewanella insulae]